MKFMSIINYIEKHLKTFNVAPHFHNYWEIIMVTSGQGDIVTEKNEIFSYNKGDLILIPPKVKHSNKSKSGFTNIHFSLLNWDLNSPVPIVVKNCSIIDDFKKLLDITYKYLHTLEYDNNFNISLSNSVTTMLDLILNKQKTDSISQTIIDEIINNYTDPEFKLDSVYALIPLSKEYVRKIFIKNQGISPLRFLMQKRIELAKRLLIAKHENPRINEIAFSCGFYDVAYFSRIFKKETGMSPNKFQMELLKTNKIFNK